MDYSNILPYTHAKFFNQSDMVMLMSRVSGDVKKSQMVAAVNMKNPTIALLLSFFVGYLGIDRFYLGHNGLGLLKLLTLGFLGLWWLIDLILISSATRKRNYNEVSYVLAGYEKDLEKFSEKIIQANMALGTHTAPTMSEVQAIMPVSSYKKPMIGKDVWLLVILFLVFFVILPEFIQFLARHNLM